MVGKSSAKIDKEMLPQVKDPELYCSLALRTMGVQRSTPLAWSADGKMFAYVSGNHSIFILKKNEHNAFVPAFSLAGHIEPVLSLNFHPTKEMLASSGSDGFFVWNVSDNVKERIFRVGSSSDLRKDAEVSAEKEPKKLKKSGSKSSMGGKTGRRSKSPQKLAPESLLASSPKAPSAEPKASSEEFFIKIADSTSRVLFKRGLASEQDDARNKNTELHEMSIEVVSFVCDGRMLATGSKDMQVKLWDTEQFKYVDTLSGHKASVLAFAYHSETKTLASAGRDSAVKLWDCAQLVASLDARAAAATADKKKKNSSDKLKVFLKGNIEGHRGDITAVIFNSAGNLLFSGARDNEIRMWNVESLDCMKTFVGHRGDIMSLALVNKDRILWSASADSTVRLWDVSNKDVAIAVSAIDEEPTIEDILADTGAVVLAEPKVAKTTMAECTCHEVNMAHMALNPCAPIMATSSVFNEVRIWSVAPMLKGNTAPNMVQEYSGHSEAVNDVQLLGDDAVFVTASSDFSSNMYDIRGDRKLADIRASATLHVATSNPARDVVFVGGTDYAVRAYARSSTSNNRACLAEFVGHSGQVVSMAMSPGGDFMVTGGFDMDMHLFPLKDIKADMVLQDGKPLTIKPIDTESNHDGKILDMDFSHDGAWLASCSTDHSIMIYKVKQGGLSGQGDCVLRTALKRAHESAVSAVAFGLGASAHLLFSGSWDKNIKVWSRKKVTSSNFTLMATIRGNKNRVTGLSVSRDGRFLASCSSSGEVMVYSTVEPFNPVAAYIPPEYQGPATSISAGDEMFVVGYSSGMVRVWPLPTEQFKPLFSDVAVVAATRM